MNKNYLFLLSIIATPLFSCNRIDKVSPYSISDIYVDFPISENIEYRYINSYAITSRPGKFIVDDSVLWVIANADKSSDNLGYCININSGDKLSVIANRGKAANEFIGIYDAKIVGDSIQFESDSEAIISFAKKDIIENKPMGERAFSSLPPIDTIYTDRKIKLPDGSVIATISGRRSARQFGVGNYSDIVSEFNKGLIAVIDDNGANSYSPLDIDRVTVHKRDGLDMDEFKPRVRAEFAASHIGINMERNLVVFSSAFQLILHTFDLKNQKSKDKKLYTIPNIGSGGDNYSNNLTIWTLDMKCDDKFIYCCVRGFFSEDDKKAKKRSLSVLVYNWDLKPVKRFNVINDNGLRCILSEDCSAIYFYDKTDEGNLSLYKAYLK